MQEETSKIYDNFGVYVVILALLVSDTNLKSSLPYKNLHFWATYYIIEDMFIWTGFLLFLSALMVNISK